MRRDAGKALTQSIAAAALLAHGVSAVAAPAAASLRCINPYSGAHFAVAIDFVRRTADGFPAAITREWISWHDAKGGGYYDFDRRSGELVARFASSMGGYFLHDRCRLAE